MVLCYVALPSEVQTAALIETALREGRAVGVPRIAGDGLRFHAPPGSDSSYERGVSGVLEPAEDSPPLEPRAGQRTLVLVPGLLFDAEGYRLGRGGGHYDRFLAQVRSSWSAKFVGLCFEEQLIEQLPRDPWDERVDAVVTEQRGLVDFGSARIVP